MLDYDRLENLTISLPLDYSGKTLVIAQSSPLVSETLESFDTVYPCMDVHLYCGYSYESSLIADASKTTIPSAILFTIGIFMLAILILQFVSILVSLSPQLDYITSSVTAFLTVLPDQLSLLALVAALICSYLMMKSGSFFHKILLLAAMALLLCYAAAVLLSIPFAPKYHMPGRKHCCPGSRTVKKETGTPA